MKAATVHYISGILAIVCFVIMAVAIYNGTSVSSMAPILVMAIICCVVNNMTKGAADRAKADMYYDMMQMHDHMQRQQAQESIRQINAFTQQMTEDAMRAAEQARLDNTGIEFGGHNTDLNLNPGMHFQQDSMMNHMDSFNNGSGMF